MNVEEYRNLHPRRSHSAYRYDNLTRTLHMRMTRSLLVLIAFCVSSNGDAVADDSTVESLKQQIEILELKLKLAETTVDQLQQDCDDLRKENVALKGEKAETPARIQDQFESGAVWAGESINDKKQKMRWAISISKRDGRRFDGVVAVKGAKGKKFEFPVTGKAPERGDGLVIIESPLIGRAKVFMRGTLRNGGIALVFSGTSPLGEKFFGSANLHPKN